MLKLINHSFIALHAILVILLSNLSFAATKEKTYTIEDTSPATTFGYVSGDQMAGIVHLDINYGPDLFSAAAGVGGMGPGAESHGIFYWGYRYKHFNTTVTDEVKALTTVEALPQVGDIYYRQHQVGFFDHIYFAPMELGGKRLKTHFDTYMYYTEIGEFWNIGPGFSAAIGYTPFTRHLYTTLDVNVRPGFLSSAVVEHGLNYVGEADVSFQAEWLVIRPLSIYAQWQNHWIFSGLTPLDIGQGWSAGVRYSWAF